MNVNREWVTPLLAGAFLLMAVTGVLMFFHLDTGLNKAAHEWLGFLVVVAAALHIGLNFKGLKKNLSVPLGRMTLAVMVVVLLATFLPLGNEEGKGGKGGGRPFAASVNALASTDLKTLALVANTTSDDIRARLSAQGITSQSDQQSIKELVGEDFGKQMHTLRDVLLAQE